MSFECSRLRTPSRRKFRGSRPMPPRESGTRSSQSSQRLHRLQTNCRPPPSVTGFSLTRTNRCLLRRVFEMLERTREHSRRPFARSIHLDERDVAATPDAQRVHSVPERDRCWCAANRASLSTRRDAKRRSLRFVGRLIARPFVAMRGGFSTWEPFSNVDFEQAQRCGSCFREFGQRPTLRPCVTRACELFSGVWRPLRATTASTARCWMPTSSLRTSCSTPRRLTLCSHASRPSTAISTRSADEPMTRILLERAGLLLARIALRRWRCGHRRTCATRQRRWRGDE